MKNLISFSEKITAIFSQLAIPARLYTHLRLVHDTAHKLLDALAVEFPGLPIEHDLVLFGAATHDIGKCVCTEELFSEGNKHEAEGNKILLRLGVNEEKARFALTHSTWNEQSTIEELLVSLSDKIWKGCRNQELEDLIVSKIASETQGKEWKVFVQLDDIIQTIAKKGDERLNWQNRFGVDERDILLS
ncbi:MAG: HD domain-containing protein [Treponema sp.]|nr:HD domain-containing protein [Treponema sp.]